MSDYTHLYAGYEINKLIAERLGYFVLQENNNTWSLYGHDRRKIGSSVSEEEAWLLAPDFSNKAEMSLMLVRDSGLHLYHDGDMWCFGKAEWHDPELCICRGWLMWFDEQ